MALDPELELGVVDFDLSDYSLLDRNAAFPAAKYPESFVFEPMPQAEVRGYRRRARTFLALHGDGGAEADEQVWIVSNP